MKKYNRPTSTNMKALCIPKEKTTSTLHRTIYCIPVIKTIAQTTQYLICMYN